jgi:hypothetical protein
MNDLSVTASVGAYAVKLLAPDVRHPERLAGRLEHVLSGRRHDFANGQALLACLAFEQQQVALDAAAVRNPFAP